LQRGESAPGYSSGNNSRALRFMPQAKTPGKFRATGRGLPGV
jgi:hypothetical protein